MSNFNFVARIAFTLVLAVMMTACGTLRMSVLAEPVLGTSDGPDVLAKGGGFTPPYPKPRSHFDTEGAKTLLFVITVLGVAGGVALATDDGELSSGMQTAAGAFVGLGVVSAVALIVIMSTE
jgi:hypothetical protein